jgi:hypothetical protein
MMLLVAGVLALNIVSQSDTVVKRPSKVQIRNVAIARQWARSRTEQ